MSDDRAHARGTDPWTSWAAARSITDLKPSHQAVLYVFHRRGEQTLEELVSNARTLNVSLSDSRLRSAACELQRLDKLEDTGETRPTSRGRDARVLRVPSASAEAGALF